MRRTRKQKINTISLNFRTNTFVGNPIFLLAGSITIVNDFATATPLSFFDHLLAGSANKFLVANHCRRFLLFFKAV
jgi:hypothetical protein